MILEIVLAVSFVWFGLIMLIILWPFISLILAFIVPALLVGGGVYWLLEGLFHFATSWSLFWSVLLGLCSGGFIVVKYREHLWWDVHEPIDLEGYEH
jgi:hypothetical protein